MTTPISKQNPSLKIDQKYTPIISSLTDDLNRFWTQKKVEKLSGFYLNWAKDLNTHHMDGLRVLHQLFDTLQDLTEPDEKGECRVKKEKETGINVHLLTCDELSSEITKLKLKIVHDIAINQFKAIEPINIDEHEKTIQNSFKFLNEIPHRVTEYSLQYQHLPFQDTHKIAHLNQEIKNVLDTSDFTTLNIQEIQKHYESILSILKTKKLTSINFYLEFIQTLIFIRYELSKNLTKPDALALVREIEKKVHLDAHKEALNLAAVYQNITPLKTAHISALFKDHLRTNEMILYNDATNKFNFVNTSESTPSNDEVSYSMSQIRNLILLIFSNDTDTLNQVKKVMGERFSVGLAIKHLMKLLESIEKKYPSLKNISKGLDKEIQKVIELHLKSTFEFAKTESKRKTPLQLSDYFTKDTPAYFYLKLSKDLNLLHLMNPSSFPTEVIANLVTSIEKNERILDEDTLLKRCVSSQGQKTTLDLYYEIQSIENTTLTHPVLQSSYQQELSSKRALFSSLINEEVSHAIYELFETSLDSDNLAFYPIPEISFDINKETLTETELREKGIYLAAILNRELENRKLENQIDTFMAQLSIETFYQTHSEAFFYLDLGDRLNSHNFILKRDSQSQPLNYFQKTVLKKIINYYRVHIQKNVLASRSKTALSELVIPNLENPEKPVKKIKEKFTEILLHGLRSYHNMLAKLSSFLEWSHMDPDSSNSYLEEEFINHLLRLNLIKKNKSKAAPKKQELNQYKKTLRSIPESMILKAKKMAKEFTSYLESYRAIQRELFKFYGALSNILIEDPSYLILPHLSIADLKMFELKLSGVRVGSQESEFQIGFYSGDDIKIAQEMQKLLPDIKELIETTPSNEQAKAFFEFLTLKTNDAGVPLSYSGISYLKIKLFIRTLQVKEMCKKIDGINIHELKKLFTTTNAHWQQFADQTQIATSAKVETQLEEFIAKNQLETMRFFTDMRPHTNEDWEYFGLDPIRMTVASINTLSKWNAFESDLTKLIKKEHICDIAEGIKKASSTMNEDLQTRECLKNQNKKKSTLT